MVCCINVSGLASYVCPDDLIIFHPDNQEGKDFFYIWLATYLLYDDFEQPYWCVVGKEQEAERPSPSEWK